MNNSLLDPLKMHVKYIILTISNNYHGQWLLLQSIFRICLHPRQYVISCSLFLDQLSPRSKFIIIFTTLNMTLQKLNTS